MEVCEVLNNLSVKTSGEASGKTVNIKGKSSVDFKKLISNLLCNKKDNLDINSVDNLINILISQLNAANITDISAENGISMDKSDIESLISNMDHSEIEALFFVQKGSSNSTADLINTLPDIKSDSSEKVTGISPEKFKSKLAELIMKIEGIDKKQVKETKELENLGALKKYFLISNKNDVQAESFQAIKTEEKPEYIKAVIEKSTPDIKQVEKESEAGTKDAEVKNQETKDSLLITDKTFNNAINKIQIKNSALTSENSLKEVRADNLSKDIVKTVSYMKENDVKSLTVKILPKELGQITIEIIYSGNKASAKLTPSSNSTFQLLDMNMINLNSELSKNGVNLQNISLNLYSGDFSEKGKGQGQEYKRKDSRKQVQEISPNEQKDETGNINIFA